MEDVLRGNGDRDRTARLLAQAASEPWFSMAYLDPAMPSPEERWHDLDYDPEPTFRAVSCPTVIYGADEECVPAGDSKAAWMRAAQVAGNSEPTIVDLPGCGHFPAASEASADLDFPVSCISPDYTAALQDWFLASR
jgi:pimeloyl-ACP methyl ester carboxylesterase